MSASASLKGTLIGTPSRRQVEGVDVVSLRMRVFDHEARENRVWKVTADGLAATYAMRLKDGDPVRVSGSISVATRNVDGTPVQFLMMKARRVDLFVPQKPMPHPVARPTSTTSRKASVMEAAEAMFRKATP